jgi:hypothetical protein
MIRLFLARPRKGTKRRTPPLIFLTVSNSARSAVRAIHFAQTALFAFSLARVIYLKIKGGPPEEKNKKPPKEEMGI